jgi:hypothetical protein
MTKNKHLAFINSNQGNNMKAKQTKGFLMVMEFINFRVVSIRDILRMGMKMDMVLRQQSVVNWRENEKRVDLLDDIWVGLSKKKHY